MKNILYTLILSLLVLGTVSAQAIGRKMHTRKATFSIDYEEGIVYVPYVRRDADIAVTSNEVRSCYLAPTPSGNPPQTLPVPGLGNLLVHTSLVIYLPVSAPVGIYFLPHENLGRLGLLVSRNIQPLPVHATGHDAGLINAANELKINVFNPTTRAINLGNQVFIGRLYATNGFRVRLVEAYQFLTDPGTK